MGFPINSEWVHQAVERGLIPADVLTPRAARSAEAESTRQQKARPALVSPLFAPPGTWLIPCEVPSLANARDWKTRNRVAQAHRRAVSVALGKQLRYLTPFAEHYHRGGLLLVRLTRLGGKTLDRTANLPSSLKYIEDAIALMVGANDGATNWRCVCDQEPGELCGVRIELEPIDQAEDLERE